MIAAIVDLRDNVPTALLATRRATLGIEILIGHAVRRRRRQAARRLDDGRSR